MKVRILILVLLNVLVLIDPNLIGVAFSVTVFYLVVTLLKSQVHAHMLTKILSSSNVYLEDKLITNLLFKDGLYQVLADKIKLQKLMQRRDVQPASLSIMEYSSRRAARDIQSLLPDHDFVIYAPNATIEMSDNKKFLSITRIMKDNLSYFPINSVIRHNQHVSLQTFKRFNMHSSVILHSDVFCAEDNKSIHDNIYFNNHHSLLWIFFQNEAILDEELKNELQQILNKLHEHLTIKQLIEAQTIQSTQQALPDMTNLAHLSHDLRSPITSIRYILELLINRELADEEIDEYLGIAVRNCKSVSDIIDDILDYHRHQNGKLHSELQDVDLYPLLQELVTELSPLARKKGLILKFEHDNTSPIVSLDNKHFKRVISNLITNACKYTEVGEVRVRLLKNESDSCVIQIVDSGIGMNEAEITRAFEPFSRLKSHSKEEGVGLGLAVVRILCELSNIEISAKSTPNIGSVFTLTCNAHSWSHVKPPIQHLLLVDDDIDYLQTCKKILSAAGYSVTTASSVCEAVMLQSSRTFDAILSDGNLEDGDASELLVAVRKKSSNTPFIVATGNAENDFVMKLQDLGASAILQKPINLQTLAEVFTDSQKNQHLRDAA